MKFLISICLDQALLQDTKTKAHLLHLSQADYIRKAIEHMNQETDKQARRQRLMRASQRVRKESMKINAEFDDIDHDPEI